MLGLGHLRKVKSCTLFLQPGEAPTASVLLFVDAHKIAEKRYRVGILDQSNRPTVDIDQLATDATNRLRDFIESMGAIQKYEMAIAGIAARANMDWRHSRSFA